MGVTIPPECFTLCVFLHFSYNFTFLMNTQNKVHVLLGSQKINLEHFLGGASVSGETLPVVHSLLDLNWTYTCTVVHRGSKHVCPPFIYCFCFYVIYEALLLWSTTGLWSAFKASVTSLTAHSDFQTHSVHHFCCGLKLKSNRHSESHLKSVLSRPPSKLQVFQMYFIKSQSGNSNWCCSES